MKSQAVMTPRHVEFKKIALLTDLGSASEAPLLFAASLAKQYGSDLLLAHAYAPEFYVSVPPEPLPNWPGSGLPPREDAEKQSRELILRHQLQDVVSMVLINESGIAGLLGDLEERRPDLVILSTHARKGLRKWLAGSVAEEVFRRAHWPVLVLPPGYLEIEPREPRFQQVLYATDMSEISSTALQYAAGIADDNQGELVALHVDPVESEGFSFNRIMDLQKLEDWLRSHRHDHTGALGHADCLVRFGEPGRQICEAAAELGADLIVLGARGFGAVSGLASHFVGGTAYEVSCTAPRPVLIVPPRQA